MNLTSFFSYFKIFFVFSETLNSLRTTPPDYEISFHYNKIVSREIRSNIGFEEAFCSVEAFSINVRCTDDRSGIIDSQPFSNCCIDHGEL